MTTTVKQHSYRTATVGNHFMELPREACMDLEMHLAKQSRQRIDNHTVYEVVYEFIDGPKTTYIWFTDSTVLFGRTLHPKNS